MKQAELSTAQVSKVSAKSIPAMAKQLAEKDAGLKLILDRYGPPPLWGRKTGFATLVHIILEQQVSLQSAKATFDRLNDHLAQNDQTLVPKNFLQLSDTTLRQCTFSRQKTRYTRLLAEAIQDKTLVLSKLAKLSDEQASERLQSIIGIGQWTADVYLLMALKRPDIWPKGDIALAEAMKQIKKREKRPDHETQLRMASRWRPYRSVAARMFWHYYLSERAKK